MKKLLSFLFFLSIFGLTYASSGKCGNNLTWELDNNGVLTITGTGDMKTYSMSNMPWRQDLVTEVVLNEGITSISKNAFAGSKITTLNLPSSITVIGDNAFKGCKLLVNVFLPQGLLTIGNSAFSGCRSLSQLQIPSSVKRIGNKAFSGCLMLSSVGIPTRIEYLGQGAFNDCYALSVITSLPEYIASSNCSLYGLPVRAVDAYKNANMTEVPTTSVSETNNTSKPFNNVKAENTMKLEPVEYGESDIDKNIPLRTVNNTRTFAFIFANENYSAMPEVPFAINDGKSFATYCHSTLGIPMSNINTYYDATYGNMLAAMEYLKQVDATFKGDINVIVYYAGHGAPDEKTSDAYLIPVDAHAVNSKVCYPLDDLYRELGQLQAKNIKVFMDACFSGTDRSNDMLAQGGRMVATVPKKASVTGNVVVVSATSSDQTAWYHKEQGHGLFTYCLIKKLQESRGEVSMGELCDYLEERVPQISIVQNRVIQSPTFQPSPALGNVWKTWTVK